MIVYITKYALDRGIIRADIDDSCYNKVNQEVFIPRKGVYIKQDWFDNYEDALQDAIKQLNSKIEEYKDSIEYFLLNKIKLVDIKDI